MRWKSHVRFWGGESLWGPTYSDFTLGGVTGVVLANASIDLALHDTVLIVLFSIIILNYFFNLNFGPILSIPLFVYSDIQGEEGMVLNSFVERSDERNHRAKELVKDREVINKMIDYNEYIKMFWVGLMDGDGSIQVNHWRQKSLQYRLIIKISNIQSNYKMLVQIAKIIGGTVRVTGKGKDVIWVVNKKQEVEEIIKIYDTYPPLTSRKICQLAFLKTSLTQTSVENYLLNRNLKYHQQLNIINSNIDFKLPMYFKVWLSGFIEAEGCFSIRKSNNHSFSIGQNDDLYLIEAIKLYFEATNKVRNPYGKFYALEIYKKEVLLNIISHCTNYPLLGEKLESLKKFNQKLS